MTTTATINDDGYIVQRAIKIVTEFNEHLTANCQHCRQLLNKIYGKEALENEK